MLDKRILEQVLSEQQLELYNLSSKTLCTRPEEQLVDLDSNMAQVVIGVRRCGKSTLCFNVLKNSGVLFAYANFDDERFEEMTSNDLNSVLEVLYKIYGPVFPSTSINLLGCQRNCVNAPWKISSSEQLPTTVLSISIYGYYTV